MTVTSILVRVNKEVSKEMTSETMSLLTLPHEVLVYIMDIRVRDGRLERAATTIQRITRGFLVQSAPLRNHLRFIEMRSHAHNELTLRPTTMGRWHMAERRLLESRGLVSTGEIGYYRFWRQWQRSWRPHLLKSADQDWDPDKAVSVSHIEPLSPVFQGHDSYPFLPNEYILLASIYVVLWRPPPQNGLPFLRKSQLMSFISVLYSDTIRPPHAPRGTTFPTSGCAKDFSYLDASQ